MVRRALLVTGAHVIHVIGGGRQSHSVELASRMINPYKLVADLVAPFSHRLLRGTAAIFTLHRFADRVRGNDGVDPARVRADLAYLRRERYELVSLTELISRLRNGDSRLGKTVAFTVDDGYADF